MDLKTKERLRLAFEVKAKEPETLTLARECDTLLGVIGNVDNTAEWVALVLLTMENRQ